MFKKMSEKTSKTLLVITLWLLCVSLIINGMFLFHARSGTESTISSDEEIPVLPQTLYKDGYTLEQVVVMSRHNIRSPLSGSGSALDDMTPYTWHDWSSNASELSIRGGALETMMGQYFRKWLEEEQLIPENWHPEDGQVRIYANSKQRTIATAEFFKTGLFPTADVSVETHVEFDTMDPVFTPQLTFISDDYRKDLSDQIYDLFGDKMAALQENYELLSKVINIEESKAFKEGTFTGFDPSDMELVLEENAEPGMKGSLKTGTSISDALVLQYYEERDHVKAAFGSDLSFEQWKMISDIKDTYGDVLFTAPLAAAHVAHPLLEVIRDELNTDGRVFTFLCGHDSNVGSILASLHAEDYDLPYAVEKKTPIGVKIVFSKWKDAEGQSYISVDLVYQTTDQLRGLSLLDTKNPPASFHITFTDLKQNKDGMYKEDDFMKHLEEAIGQYDVLKQTYGIE